MFSRRGWSAALLASMTVSCGGGNDEAPAHLLTRGGGISQGRHMVVLNPEADGRDVLQALVERRGLRASHYTSASIAAAFGSRSYERIGEMALELTADDVALLEGLSFVRAVHPVKKVHMVAVQDKPPSWGLDRIDQVPVKLDKKFAYADGAGAGVRAFVIDTGLDARHSEFAGRVREGFSIIDDGKGTHDCQGHGTHVAGTVLGTLFGVAKRAEIAAVRVLDCEGSGTDEGVVAGMNWVMEQKAKDARVPMVVNMSLGGDASEALDGAVQRLVEAGVFVAVAAGNESQNACDVSPARAAAAVTVGATEITDDPATFSNFGDCVDIYAPGVSINSAKVGGGNHWLSGTSMASPHVAGVAALILGNNPTFTPAQVEHHMKRLAVRNGVKGVVSDHVSNYLLQVERGVSPAPAPVPTPTPVPTPGNGPSVIYQDALGSFGVKSIFVRQSSVPVQGKVRLEGQLTGTARTNFDLQLRVWDKARMKWMDVASSRGPRSDESVTWSGDVTNFEWIVRNVGRETGTYRLVVKYGQ